MTAHFNKWGDACSAVLRGQGAEFTCILGNGRKFTRKDVLVSIGYDGAKKHGVLHEYKRDILGIAE